MQLIKCCKYLIEKYPEGAVTKTSDSEETPFHLACANGSLQLVNFLYDINPSSITEQTHDREYEYDDDGEDLDWTEHSGLQSGYYALHLAVSNQHVDRKDIVQFILENDKNAASRSHVLRPKYRRAASRVGTWGRLPLHQACASNMNLDIVKNIFEAYPKAIHTEDMFGRLPIHYAFGCAELRKNQYGDSFKPTPSSKRQTSLVIDFLAEQLPYSISAQDSQGRVCAHYASASSLAINKIALIEKKCPESFTIPTKGHGCPIHYACTSGAGVEVVAHLVSRFSPRSITVEHPYLGSPIACARDFNSFGFLLSAYSTIVNNSSDGTAFHKLMLDDNIKVKDHIIKRFIEFSKLEPRTRDFQDDVRTKDKKTGTYPLHLVFGVAFRTLIDSVKPEIQSHLIRRNIAHLEELIDCYPRALEEVDNRGWLPLHHAVRHNAPLKMIQLLLERYPMRVYKLQINKAQHHCTLHFDMVCLIKKLNI